MQSGDDDGWAHWVHLVIEYISFVVHTYEIYVTFESKYYWFFFGQNLGKVLTHAFLFLQDWGAYDIIASSPQWERFVPGSH